MRLVDLVGRRNEKPRFARARVVDGNPDSFLAKPAGDGKRSGFAERLIGFRVAHRVRVSRDEKLNFRESAVLRECLCELLVRANELGRFRVANDESARFEEHVLVWDVDAPGIEFEIRVEPVGIDGANVDAKDPRAVGLRPGDASAFTRFLPIERLREMRERLSFVRKNPNLERASVTINRDGERALVEIHRVVRERDGGRLLKRRFERERHRLRALALTHFERARPLHGAGCMSEWNLVSARPNFGAVERGLRAIRRRERDSKRRRRRAEVDDELRMSLADERRRYRFDAQEPIVRPCVGGKECNEAKEHGPGWVSGHFRSPRHDSGRSVVGRFSRKRFYHAVEEGLLPSGSRQAASRGKTVLSADRLLGEIQRVLEGRRDPATVKRRLAAIAGRPGAAELLSRVLQTGDVVDAQLAALALPYATNELVRLRLQREARDSTGARRAIVLSALTDDELADVLSGVGEGAEDWLVEAMGLFAVNDPEDFVDTLAESVAVVGVKLVEHIERVRAAYAIPLAAIYGPLLGRRLSTRARERVLGLLGRDPSDEARALLDREQARVVRDDDKRLVRRERMRQRTLAIEGTHADERPSGTAFLSPVGPRDTAVLELVEELEDGRGVRTTVILAMNRSAEAFSHPLEESLESLRAGQVSDVVELSLSRALGLLESLPLKHRRALWPVFERLSSLSAEPVARPAPDEELSREEAWSVASHEAFVRWRPLAALVGWADQTLEAPVDGDTFPVSAKELAERAASELAAMFGKASSREAFAAGLRHMALWMALQGDERAKGVAAEALRVTKRRPGALSFAMAERDLLLQRWSLGRLPEDFRRDVRSAVRRALSVEEVGWKDVALLDFAQASAEGMARAKGFARQSSAPEVPSEEELELAIVVARRALESVRSKPVQQALRKGQLSSLAAEAREWVGDAPVETVFQIVQFVSSTCLGSCPYDCLRRHPKEEAREVFDGPGPLPPSLD